MRFRLLIQKEAHNDIQQAIDWYDKKQSGLGNKFRKDVFSCFAKLATYPYYQIRYDEVRCLPLKTFPFMLHFTVEEEDQTVTLRAVFHTSRNPENWKERK